MQTKTTAANQLNQTPNHYTPFLRLTTPYITPMESSFSCDWEGNTMNVTPKTCVSKNKPIPERSRSQGKRIVDCICFFFCVFVWRMERKKSKIENRTTKSQQRRTCGHVSQERKKKTKKQRTTTKQSSTIKRANSKVQDQGGKQSTTTKRGKTIVRDRFFFFLSGRRQQWRWREGEKDDIWVLLVEKVCWRRMGRRRRQRGQKGLRISTKFKGV